MADCLASVARLNFTQTGPLHLIDSAGIVPPVSRSLAISRAATGCSRVTDGKWSRNRSRRIAGGEVVDEVLDREARTGEHGVPLSTAGSHRTTDSSVGIIAPDLTNPCYTAKHD